MSARHERVVEGAKQLGVAAAYLAGCLLSVATGLITRGASGQVSVVWLPPGIALAIALTSGRRHLPGIWLGAFAADWLLGVYEAPTLPLLSRLVLALLLSAATLLQVESNRRLVQRFAGAPLRLDTPKSFVAYLACGALASLSTTTTGSVALVWFGIRSPASLLHDWVSWWMSDAVSVVLVTPVALAWWGRPRHVWRPRRLTLGVPLLLVLISLGAAFFQANKLEFERNGDEFRARADDLSVSFERTLKDADNATLAVADFAHSSARLDGAEFVEFAARARRRTPSLLAVTWVPRVQAEERAQFERSSFSGGPPQTIRELGADGQLTEAGQRDRYFPVEILDISLSLPWFSHFDLWSVESRRRLLEEADRAGGLVMSAPVELVGLNRNPGLLLVTAVKGERGETRGFVICVARISELVGVAASGSMLADLEFTLTDLAAPFGQTLFKSAGWRPGAGGAPYSMVRELRNGGRNWVLSVQPTRSYMAAHPLWLAWAFSVVGLGMALSLCGLLLVTSGQNASIAHQVKLRTLELSDANQRLREQIETHRRTEHALQESELRWQFALEEAGEGVWDWDVLSDTLYWSPRLIRVLGYAPEEFVPSFETWRRVVHPDDLAPVERLLRRYLAGEVEEFRTELRLRHKDGRFLWFETSAKVVSRSADGQPLRMVGTQANINERKLAEHALMVHREQLEGLVRARTLELSAAKATAEKANRAKSVFLANMSHELRTPLHAVLGYARLGIEKAQPGKLRDYFARVVEGAERLLVVLNDLLDLSKLEAGKMLVTFASCDVESLVRSVAGSLEPLLSRKHLQFSVEREANCASGMAHIDRTRMAQVLENILANAIRFSHDGGRIDVRLSLSSLPGKNGSAVPALAISVADQGVGIPESELEQIFDSFTQSSKTDTHAGGTGLGLAICRELMALHKGSVNARNNSGPGATFIVTVPSDDSAWSNAA